LCFDCPTIAKPRNVTCHFKTDNTLTRLLIIKTIFTLTILTSCGQTDNRAVKETSEQNVGSTTITKPKLVDYKSDTYKILLGDNYKKSDLIIDWRWASEADTDGRIDSTGKDAFMFLGEPLIKYNEEEWLPSLHIETDNNIITSFTCSVLFNLADITNSETTFLRILSKDIKQLENNEVIKTLTKQGVYEIKTQEVIEVFRLTKGKEYEYDKFEYTVKPR